MVKRIFSVCIACALMFAVSACGNDTNGNTNNMTDDYLMGDGLNNNITNGTDMTAR